MSSDSYLIGVDGGGSKTAVVLTDLALRPLRLITRPRSNPGDIGMESSLSLVVDSCRDLCAEAGIAPASVRALFAGIAGGSAGNYAKQLIDRLSQAFPGTMCGASDDGTNVLYASFPETDGVCIICGTGSSCFVKHKGKIYRIGGFGQFDLKGNGFEIGRAAFTHVFRVQDGRSPNSWLADAVNAQFDGGAYRHIMEINQYGKNDFAKFAPLVFEAAERHEDLCALALLKDQLGHIAELIDSAGRFFPGDYEVSLSGGIMRHSLAVDLIRQQISGRARLFHAENEPYIGAAAKAGALLRGDPPLILPCFLAASQLPD